MAQKRQLEAEGNPTSMSSASHAALGPVFQISDLVHVIRERSGLIRIVAVAIVALAVAVATILPTLYSTSASVMLDPRKNNVVDMSAVVSEMPTDPASVQNQIQILTSRDLAGRVIDKLGLAQDPQFNPSLEPGILAFLSPADQSPQGLRDAEITAFLKHLSADAVGLSTAISISYSARDPQTR